MRWVWTESYALVAQAESRWKGTVFSNLKRIQVAMGGERRWTSVNSARVPLVKTIASSREHLI